MSYSLINGVIRSHLKDIGPHVVEEMCQGIIVAEAEHSESHVLDGCASRLSVHQVTVHQGIRQQGCDRIDVVFAHLSENLC